MGSKFYRISWKTSLTLDIFRLSAALVVFIFHVYIKWFNNDFVHKLAHFSVIIFFVLSGYLIFFSTSSNNRGPVQYANARLSKLYSVLIPSILITALCELIIYYINPVFHQEYTRSPVLFRYFISFFFLNEAGSFSASPPMNSPLWSLSYEFWYYVIFGFWFYFRRFWQTYILLLITLFIAGPPILILFPIWIMGGLAYKIPHQLNSYPTSWKLFFTIFLLLPLMLIYLPGLPFTLGYAPLYFGNQFLTDYILGFSFALALSVITKANSMEATPVGVKKFRKIADLTFPLYLLHYPILILWICLFPTKRGDVWQFLLSMICVFIIVIIIGLFIERKRHFWDNLVGVLLKKITSSLPMFVSKKI